MLIVKNLSAGYKDIKIIDEINLYLDKGEMVAIVGPNGSGKTTILRAIIGNIEEYGGKIFQGEIIFKETIINGYKPHALLAMGIAFVPDGGKVFSNMSALENLELGGYIIKNNKNLAKRIEMILELFPILKPILKRKASTFSGGERQILSLSKALITQPEFLILDEPTSGLSPNYVITLFENLLYLKKKRGVLIVEQNAKIALEYSDRAYIVRHGKIDSEGSAEELLKKEDIFKLL